MKKNIVYMDEDNFYLDVSPVAPVLVRYL
jgi:hypothetical protein